MGAASGWRVESVDWSWSGTVGGVDPGVCGVLWWGAATGSASFATSFVVDRTGGDLERDSRRRTSVCHC